MRIARSVLAKPMVGLPIAALGIAVLWPLAGLGQAESVDKVQNAKSGHDHSAKKSANLSDLAKKLAELGGKVKLLETILKSNFRGQNSQTGHANTKKAVGGMMQGKGMMGGMSKDMQSADGTAQMMKMMKMMMQMKMMEMMEKQGGMSGMNMEKMSGGMGMKMMGGTHAKGRTHASSALPGFPGASHIYHVGATGFFLDHPDHISLTKEQQTSLNKIKENASLQQESFQRKIEEAETNLFVLTGSDQPDASKVEAKVREIEKLRGDIRLAFIRAVGDAAKVLTADQRKVLLGFMSPKAEKSDSRSKHNKSKADISK